MVHCTARRLTIPHVDACRPAVAALLVALSFGTEGGAIHASDPKSLGQASAVEPAPAAVDAAVVPGTTGVIEEPAPRPAEFAAQEGVLALIDGRVVSGMISPAPGGYMLKRRGSSDEMVPAFLVHTASDSLTGCYENLRDAVRHPRPDDHLKLADWCIRQKLLDEARTEVVAALQLDPNRREARELLLRLEEYLNPKPRHLQTEAAAARRTDGFLEGGVRTTEGISPESTSLFVRRIQPLMVSKCGNAACHGGDAGGEFHLGNVRRTSSSGRTTTLENLREVLEFVDAADPVGTRLLVALQSPAHAGVFSGTAAASQEAALRSWVLGAAGDKGLHQEAPVPGASPVWTRDAIALVSGEKASGEGVGGQDSVSSARGSRVSAARGQATPLQRAVRAPLLQKVGGEEALVEKVLKEERADPFDPAEFHRLVIRGVPGNPQNPR